MPDKRISDLTAYTTPIATDILPITDVTAGITKKVTKSDLTSDKVTGNVAITPATGMKITADAKGLVTVVADAALTDLSDVVIATPATDEVLRFNGTEWVNGAAVTSSASSGIEFFPDDTSIVAAGTENAYPIKTLSKIPIASAEDVDSIAMTANSVMYGSYLYDTAIGRTSLDAGVWTFDVYAGVSSATNATSLQQNVNRVRPGTGTVTTTGTGTTRTAVASTGTPFATDAIDVGGTILTDSFLQTTTGLFRILSRVSDTEITVETLSTYTNQTTVAYSVHKKLFGITTPEINNLAGASPYAGLQLYSISSVQSAFTVLATDKLSNTFFGTSNGTRTVYFSHNGTTRYSHFTTPLITLHNNLAGLQGGTANEMYHLTAAQSTVVSNTSGTNTGDANGHSALAPIDNPTFTTGITTPAIKITTGAGASKVLTSDADGDATWEIPVPGFNFLLAQVFN